VKLRTYEVEACALSLAVQECEHVRNGADAMLSLAVHTAPAAVYVSCHRLSCMAEVAFTARRVVNESRLEGPARPPRTCEEDDS